MLQEVNAQMRDNAGSLLLSSEISIRVPSNLFLMTTQQFADCLQALAREPEI